MKTIESIDLDEVYADEFRNAKSYIGNYGINKLLEMFQEEENPVDFKEQLLMITQLYYDGILKNQKWYDNVFGRKSKDFSLKLEILNKLILAGRVSVGSFYEGKGIDTDEVKDILIPYISDIMKYNKTDISSKTRHLRFYSYGVQKFGISLQERLENDFEVPDLIVSVASGGFEPAYLAMHIMEMDDLFVLRYSKDKCDSTVQVFGKDNNYFSGNNLIGNNVFVIDDIIENGDTMFEVLKYVVNLKPSKLYGSSIMCVYITPLVPHIEKMGSKPFLFKYNLDS